MNCIVLNLESREYSDSLPYYENGDNWFIYAQYAEHLYIVLSQLNNRLVGSNMEPNNEQRKFIAEANVMEKIVQIMDEGDLDEQKVMATHYLCQQAIKFNDPKKRHEIYEKDDQIINSDGLTLTK